MADRADSRVSFTGAVAFSLEKLGLPDVSLKAEQRSAIKAMYEGRVRAMGMKATSSRNSCQRNTCQEYLPKLTYDPHRLMTPVNRHRLSIGWAASGKIIMTIG